MHPDRSVPPDQPLSLHLAAGDELVCTAGLLRLTTTGPWLGEAWAPPAQQLPTGQARRACADLWVRLESVRQTSRFRLIPALQAVQLSEKNLPPATNPASPRRRHQLEFVPAAALPARCERPIDQV
jgi:hypothetical protein